MPEIFSSAQVKSDTPTLDATKELLSGMRKRRHGKHQELVHPGTPRHKRFVDDYSQVMANERRSTNPFNAFVPKPFKTFFASQATGEQVILLLRKHPITQLKWIISAIIFAIVPMFLSYFQFFSFLPANYLFAAHVGWYLMLVGFVLESFLTWYFNVYIITDERIVDIDFLSLIYRNISSAKIDNIEDVSAQTSGALRSVFDFGSVLTQTAAEKTEFEFEDVPHPNKIIAVINDLLLEEEREKIEGRIN